MSDKNQTPKKEPTEKSNAELIAKLEAAGFKRVQKTGGILMPVSKEQRESMEKNKKD